MMAESTGRRGRTRLPVPHPSPFHSLRAAGGGSSEPPDDPALGVTERGPVTRLVEQLESRLGKGAPLLCAACGNGITTPSARTTLFGQYVHHKTNPYGFQFVIGCFSEAPGCAIQGDPVPQDTWFPGYTWRFALCDNCGTHLGWYYESPSQSYFYGLVLERLVEEESGQSGGA
jgi:hypothetical protein